MRWILAPLAAATLLFWCTPAAAQIKPCEELRREIDAKIKAKGATGYTLTIVTPSETKGGKVVGSCDGGAKRILYVKGVPEKPAQPAEPEHHAGFAVPRSSPANAAPFSSVKKDAVPSAFDVRRARREA